jgi:thiosulfate/3-mercaptopyruvate sulfurtransferase
MTDYARPDLLVSTEWLAEHLNDPNVRIIEQLHDPGPEPFEGGHVPGAAPSPDWQIKGSHNDKLVAPPEEAKAWFESVGIGDDTLVIGYDRIKSRDAARLWWVLTYYGHSRVKVLDGGWKKWTAEGRAVEVGPSHVATSGNRFTPKPADREIESNVDKLRAAVGRSDTVIWDVRSVEEYTGANARGNKRAGHVPGAVHLEWSDLVNDDDHTFKPADELSSMLKAIGVTPEKTVHTY